MCSHSSTAVFVPGGKCLGQNPIIVLVARITLHASLPHCYLVDCQLYQVHMTVRHHGLHIHSGHYTVLVGDSSDYVLDDDTDSKTAELGDPEDTSTSMYVLVLCQNQPPHSRDSLHRVAVASTKRGVAERRDYPLVWNGDRALNHPCPPRFIFAGQSLTTLFSCIRKGN